MIHNCCGFVYILTNFTNKVLYVGVTSELRHRIYKHKDNFYPNSFSAKYKIHKIVWYETFHYIEDTIKREKQIKAGSRKVKEDLINLLNPGWKDLREEIKDL